MTFKNVSLKRFTSASVEELKTENNPNAQNERG